MNLFDSIKEEKTIFKNEEVFNQDYLPEEILHREREIKEIAISLKGVVDKKGENVFLYGPTGTGKTSCAKYVIGELCEYSQKVLGIYINCWNFSTRFSVLSQVAYSLDEFVPRRGLAPDQLIEMIANSSKKNGKTPIIILDEIDTLKKRGEEGLLYDLLRIEENLGGKLKCIMITNEQDFIIKLDRRIKSSLVQKSIQFVPYRPNELKDIIKERAKLGLAFGSYDEDVIGACAGFGARNRGDARIAIRLLFRAGKEAEKNGKTKIEIGDVEGAKKQVSFEIEEKEKEHLSNNDRLVLDNIGSEWMDSSQLYSGIDLDKRLARMSIEKLEKFGFIETRTEGKNEGKRLRRV